MDKPWLKFYEDEVPPEIEIPEIALPLLFEQSVAKNPNGSAVSFFGKKITYAELGSLVNQFAIALTRLGVNQGDRVAIMLPNIPQYPVIHFAALKIGAILVPTNPLYVERELEYQLNNSGAETIVALDTHFPKIKQVKPKTDLRNVVLTKVQEYLPGLSKLLYPLKAKKEGNWYKVNRVPGVHFFEDLISEKFVSASLNVKVKPDEVAMFLYTGGTTGVSKGAVLTHRNLVANVLQIKTWCCEVKEQEEVVLCALPFFHSFGLTTCLHMAVVLSSPMVLIPNPRDIKTLLKAIQKENATLFSGVPTLFVAINNFPEIAKYDLSSIKACVSGGAPLPLEVARQFEKISHGELVEGYGLSETSPVTHANSIKGKRKKGSIGMPVPNTDVRVVDPETKKPVPTGEVGELAVRGPQVMKGYWKMEKETNEVLRAGWLYTGDMTKMDEEGYFYIVDRKKDMIIAGGFNIFPREIEEVLYEHPEILEAAVIGVPDEYRGETVKAFVVPKPGASLHSEEVIKFCKSKMAAFKVPRQVEFRDSLPKSNIGKVLRRILQEEIENTKAVSNKN